MKASEKQGNKSAFRLLAVLRCDIQRDMKRFYSIAVACTVVFLAGCAAINRAEQKTLVQHNVSPVVCDRMVQGEILTLSDIIELSRRDVAPQLIVHYLYSTRAVYVLDKQALARLNQARVSKDVVDYLLETPSLFAPRFYPAPYYYPAPCYPYGTFYPYDPWGPRFYGSTSVVVVSERGRHR